MITALLMATLLLVFVAALVAGLRQNGFATRVFQDEAAVLAVAEAGAAHAMAKLDEDLSWTDGFNQVSMLNSEGRYSVTFSLDPAVSPVAPEESVNNLIGATAVNGPRGLGSVSPHTAEIVVNAEVGAKSRRLTVIIKKGPPPSDNSAASTRKVRIHGDTVVSGITSLEDPLEIPAGVHSNMDSPSGTVILWTADSGDQVSVSGTVSSVTGNPAAIDFSDPDGTATLAGSPPTEPGADEVSIPDIDIKSRIDAKSSSPAPVTAPGLTVLSSGDYYVSGDLVYSGDLHLDSADLYVDGDLTLTGALKGSGAVFVAGETQVKGSVEIATTNDQNVALFSHGSIKLTGYDGSQYMEDIAAGDAQFASDYATAQTAYAALRANMDAQTYPYSTADRDDMDEIRRVLGSAGSGATYAGLDPAVLLSMRDNLQLNYPVSSTRDFIIQKLDAQARFFWGRAESFDDVAPSPEDVIVDDWLSGMHQKFAIFDIVIDQNNVGYIDLENQMEVFVDQVNWDNPGTSYFQGLVYTKGFLYAGQEITVVGAVMTQGDETLPGENINGVSLEPGDIFLADRSTLVFNKQYFDGSGSDGGGILRIVTWIGR